MKRPNHELRLKIYASGLKQWQVAERYGLNEGNFSRLLRHELSEEKKQRIIEIIEQLKTKERILDDSKR